MNKPLWEAHIIEGLAGDRFAFYFKAHHCAVDGTGAMNLVKAWLSTDPRGLPGAGGADPGRQFTLIDRITVPVSRVTDGLAATTELVGRLFSMACGEHSTIRAAGHRPAHRALQKLPPLFNFTVSNVVLSREPLYLLGARLELLVPVSFLADGYGLNVTLVGYTDKVALGFVGCRDTIPHLQSLAVYAADALAELEDALS